MLRTRFRNIHWFVSIPMALSVVLLMILAACGGDDPAATAPPQEAEVPTATAVPVVESTPTTAPAMADDKQGGELRIGMTAADIPLTDVQADQGFEGWRFVGFQLNNGLTTWDWNGETIPGPVPGLAESWEVDPDNPKRWVFHLRDGLKFHDGTDIDAEAVVLSSYRLFNEDHPYYDAQVAGLGNWIWSGSCCEGEAFKALDSKTVELTTTEVNGYVPYGVVSVHIASPTALEQWGSEGFASNHVGAGPFKLVSQTPRVSMTMERFEDYWGNQPNVDRVILRPLPEPTTRLAAFRADEVDWIEVPPPDAIATLKEEGYDVRTKVYPHVWPYQFNLLRPPFDNKLVRQALNYAVDREGICRDLLSGTCTPSTGFAYEGHASFGNPANTYSYDPEKAKELLAEAGVELPLKMKLLISTSGSGQMLPIQMNEFVQRNFNEVGVEMELVPVDWNAMLSRTIFSGRGNYSFTEENADIDAYNISWAYIAPYQWPGFFQTNGGLNTQAYSNAGVDRLLKEAQESIDFAEQDRILGEVHELVIEDAPYVFIVHDLNPRALNSRVKGYVQDRSWFTNLQDLWIEP